MSRLYRALLLAYPRSFRYRFGRAMAEAFEDELAELRARGAVIAMAQTMSRIVRDALQTSLEMRWAHWRGRPGAPLSLRETTSWKIGRSPGSRSSGTGPGMTPRTPRDVVRETARFAFVDGLLMDLKFAVRGLRRNPGFAAVAILTLAIAIGANTAIFSVVDGVLLTPLPVFEPENLVVVMEHHAIRDGSFRQYAVSPANFLDWQERNHVFSGMTLIADATATLDDSDDAEQLQGLRVSANFFEVVGVPAELGRTFRPEEDAPDAPSVVVISHGLWQRAFAADRAAIGEVVSLSGAPHTIIGVAPASFSFARIRGGSADTATRDFWALDPFGRFARTERRNRLLSVVARLGPGVTVEQAREEMHGIAEALAAEYPDINVNRITGEANSVYVGGLHRSLVGNMRPALWMLMGAVGLVLVIACTNIANLLLVRAAARRREVAVRAAIGAGRLRLARQALTEAVLLAAFGGAGGLLLAWWAVPTILPLAPVDIPPPLLRNVGIDGGVLAFTTLVCLGTAIAFGLAPALRSSGNGPGPGLRGVDEEGARGRWLPRRQLLVATEIALALVLMVGLGLLAATFTRLYTIPLGFDTNDAYTASISLAGSRGRSVAENRETAELIRMVVGRLEALPEVETAAATNLLPLRTNTAGSDLQIEGRPIRAGESAELGSTVNEANEPDFAMLRYVTPGYFEALRIPLLRGRRLAWLDDTSVGDVAVINETMAEEYWPGQNPIGRRVATTSPGWTAGDALQFVEVVGVVGNIWERNHYAITDDWVGSPFPPTMYAPIAQRRVRSVNFVVRQRGTDAGFVSAVAGALRSIDPGRRVEGPEPLEDYVIGLLVSDELRFCTVIIGIMTGIALLLALMGVYGTMAFHVAGRTHEIGVRMALGSRAGAIVALFVGQALRIAVLGAVGGVLIALGTTHLLSRWLYEVSPTDPLVFASLSTVMVAVAVLACWIPARRAARVDPITSLRAE